VLLSACKSNYVAPPGTPVLTMGSTDNIRDYASYIVNIDGITLTTNTGTLVAPLSTTETVDLVPLQSVTEVVAAPAVPAGTYTSGTITVDYTSNEYAYLNEGGKAVPAEFISPLTNTLPTTYTINITFDPKHPLVVTQYEGVRLQVEVDLTASNSIDYSTPSVYVQPFALMTPAPLDSTPMRWRGLYVTEQGVLHGFIMNTRPFYDLVSAIGAVFVEINDKTYFNINGIAYTGSAGLAALNGVQLSTPVVAYGTLANVGSITPYFDATEVYAGTSQESELAEYVTGVVTSRNNDVLRLRGVTYLTPEGTTQFFTDLPVLIGPDTVVSQDGFDVPGLTTDSISVGQLVNISGQANISATTGYPTTINGTEGQVRLQSTTIWGNLNSATSDSASLELLSSQGYATEGFTFGSGTTPHAFQVETGSTDLSTLAPGTLLQSQGFITPYNAAPPNFTATSITPGTSTLQQIVYEWGKGGTATPFSSLGSAGIVVDLSNASLDNVHYIRTGPSTIDITKLPASPLITTVGANQSQLQLAVGSATLTDGVSVFNDYPSFQSAIQNLLKANKAFRLVAYGQYDAATNTFVTARIHLALQESDTTTS
jgi:hypothetical protein